MGLPDMPKTESNTTGRRRVLVTGAATGIGAAIVDVFVDSGADVVATFHEAPSPERSQATWLHCDVTSVTSVNETVDAAAAAMGGLDAVIHAAGLWLPGIAGAITDADIDRLVSINLRGTIHVNQAAHRVMQGSGGRIINFGSAEAVMGSPISAVYAATKGAVHAWTRSAAKAWASGGITVNAIAPAMQTPGADRLRTFLGPEGAAFMDENLKLAIPLRGALGEPAEDLGPFLVFLAGEGSGFITGQLLAVDGGLVMLGA
ncbi:SDR family NAD(P)-dependent oxidoreductase [Mycobacterium sp. GA-1841]|uniref:SDR family NAD(P)-dependent oxidoreductase n=1 Tax=Mycobacterium sp. GA-1841 TaxID=1834154 RepID=UPI00352FBD4D